MKTLPGLILFFFLSSTAGAFDEPPCFYWKLENLERYVYPSDMEHLNWREIRSQRSQRKTANMDPKVLTLNPCRTKDWVFPSSITVFAMDPDGNIATYREPSVTLPEDSDLIGRYLLASTVPVEIVEMDQNRTFESVVLCAKGLVTHYKNGGRQGKTSVVFWDDPDRLPLEIGPVLDTAKSRYGGGIQLTHRDYEMMVKYRAEPLADALVTVRALDSGWTNTLVTDARGIFRVMPTDDRWSDTDFQPYVYTAQHHDKKTGRVYVATFPVTVYKNRPEWQTKALGFTYWAIAGTGLTLVLMIGYRKRRIWEDQRTLVIFEHHRIKPS